MKWVVRILILFYLLFPIYWAINTSLKTDTELVSKTTYIVQKPTLAQYAVVIQNPFLPRALFNSCIVAFVSVSIALILGTWAGYALGRLRFKGRKHILYIILVMTMFPQISILSGLFSIITKLRLYGSLFALFLTYPLLTLPISIWFFTYFYRRLPDSLEEAASMDGASFSQFYWYILLPLSKPALASIGIICLVLVWNEYLYALMFTFITPESHTVTVAVSRSGSIAAALLLTLPIVLVVLLFQRGIVNNLGKTTINV